MVIALYQALFGADHIVGAANRFAPFAVGANSFNIIRKNQDPCSFQLFLDIILLFLSFVKTNHKFTKNTKKTGKKRPQIILLISIGHRGKSSSKR